MPDDDRGHEQGRRANRIEVAGVLLIALASVFTAWSAFQSSKWSGTMALRFNEAGTARTESTRASNLASDHVAVDVSLFSGYVSAVAAEDPDLASFVEDRFTDRLAEAVEAWMATDPLESAAAPASPFEMDEYVVQERELAIELKARAEERTTAARSANQTSDNYAVTSVFFATAILLSALSSKVQSEPLQFRMLVGAVVILAGTAVVIATYPIEI